MILKSSKQFKVAKRKEGLRILLNWMLKIAYEIKANKFAVSKAFVNNASS